MLARSHEPEKRRRALRLPYSAGEILSRSLDLLHTAAGERSWALTPGDYKDEVTHYHTRHKTLGLKGPRPRLRQVIDKGDAEEMGLKTDAAFQFLGMVHNSDPFVLPITLYYAVAHLTGVYSRAFFLWDQDSRVHGVSVTHKSGNVGATELKIQDAGHFPRVASAVFLLTGVPSYFSELATYAQAPQAHTGPGEFLEKFGQAEQGNYPRVLTLDALVNLDILQTVQEVKSHFHFHKWRGIGATLFTADLLAIFAASSIARYDVVGWRKILEGKGNAYRLYFDTVFERFIDFGFDYVVASLVEPHLFWNPPGSPFSNPYLDDDLAKAVIS